MNRTEPSEETSSENIQVHALLTMEEARQQLRISRWSLNKLVQRHQLATIRIGRRRLVPVNAVNDLIEQLRVEAST
ncbi:helix-turn-helix domain-containing protein [Amycolatopsis sp. H20-H5]|uniref:helix-turn-helix domain-containing protein n=1 Tax=Amycolatopsis sp. H20-H5 TaxID=3046309 RepID=UPI002DBD47DC|nr:helix-turn-helix domain-containing protein [Amycolatopsis sp. H20-H5]MEC3979529.1 helix-turn-helix domain-containing protein [Amycolatopsis sp. H20-H5]